MDAPHPFDASERTRLERAARHLAEEQRIPCGAFAQQHDDGPVDRAGQNLAHHRRDLRVGQRSQLDQCRAVGEHDVQQRLRDRLTIASGCDEVDGPCTAQRRDHTSRRPVQQRKVVDDDHRPSSTCDEDVAQRADQPHRVCGRTRTRREHVRNRAEGHLGGGRGALHAVNGAAEDGAPQPDLFQATRPPAAQGCAQQGDGRGDLSRRADRVDHRRNDSVAADTGPRLRGFTERQLRRSVLGDVPSMHSCASRPSRHARRVLRVSVMPASNSAEATPAISQLEPPVLGRPPPLLSTTVVSGIVVSGMVVSSTQSAVTASE